MGKKTGPKTNWKMSDDTIRKLEQAFAIGADVTKACAYADISHDTYYRWIKEKPELSERFSRLQEQPILKALQEVVKGMDNNPELALKYLERRWKDRYSTRVENTGADGEDLKLTQIIVGDIKDLE